MKEPVLLGSDLDEEAIEIARTNLASAPHQLWCANSATLDLQRSDVTLTLANLPFGKQFKAGEGSELLYERILGRVLLHAAPSWRACVVTNDERALVSAVASITSLSLEKIATTRVRGQSANIYLLRR